MTKEFEELESEAEMVDWLVGEEEEDEDEGVEEEAELEEETIEDVKMDLQVLNLQMFVKLLPRYLAMEPPVRADFDEAVRIFNDPRINILVRHSALAAMHEMLLPDEAVAVKQIARKEKVYNVPCEDCERGPTHLVEFKEGDRTEQHYLCEGCEKDARKE